MLRVLSMPSEFSSEKLVGDDWARAQAGRAEFLELPGSNGNP